MLFWNYARIHLFICETKIWGTVNVKKRALPTTFNNRIYYGPWHVTIFQSSDSSSFSSHIDWAGEEATSRLHNKGCLGVEGGSKSGWPLLLMSNDFYCYPVLHNCDLVTNKMKNSVQTTVIMWFCACKIW